MKAFDKLITYNHKNKCQKTTNMRTGELIQIVLDNQNYMMVFGGISMAATLIGLGLKLRRKCF